MDVFSAIANRKSIRAYQSTPVEEEKLLKILEAGRLSPSANNRQEWKFIVVRDEETKQKMIPAMRNQTFAGEAPVLLVACATESQAIMTCGQPAYTVDVSIAFSYMILEAYALGLGTCWLGAFDESAVKEILCIPEEIRVVAITPIGYPAKEHYSRPRKELNQIVCYEKYE